MGRAARGRVLTHRCLRKRKYTGKITCPVVLIILTFVESVLLARHQCWVIGSYPYHLPLQDEEVVSETLRDMPEVTEQG